MADPYTVYSMFWYINIYKYIYIRRCIGNISLHPSWEAIFYAVRWCFFFCVCVRVFFFLPKMCYYLLTHTQKGATASHQPKRHLFVWMFQCEQLVQKRVCACISGVCKWVGRHLLTLKKGKGKKEDIWKCTYFFFLNWRLVFLAWFSLCNGM